MQTLTVSQVTYAIKTITLNKKTHQNVYFKSIRGKIIHTPNNEGPITSKNTAMIRLSKQRRVKMTSLRQKIEQALSDLSDAERRIGEYVLGNSEAVPHMTTKELSKKAAVSEATIIRFCKSIGIGSYKSFKLALMKDLTLTDTSLTDFSVLNKKDSPYDLFHKVIHVNKSAVESCADSLDRKELTKAVEAIRDARKIVFFGVGGSSTAAVDAQYKFTKLGYHSITSLDFHHMLSVIPHLTEKDVFVAISTSGKTKDVLELTRFAQRKGATVIAITTLSKSPLYKEADIHLCTPNVEQDFRIGSLASRMTQLTVIDTLYLSIFHHVGEKVLQQYYDARSEMERLRR